MILAPTLSLLSSGSGAIVRPTFSRDFAGERTLNNGTGPAITFTRGSIGTYFDANGTLQTASTDVPRFDHSGGSSLGLLIEEARTNSIRNSQAENAVVGAPGTMPTNWSAGVVTGITAEVVATGSTGGLNYVDVRYSGTNASGSSVFPGILFENVTQIVASATQTWTASFYAALVAGNTTGLASVNADIYETTAAGVFVTNSSTAITLGATLTRYAHTRTLTGATTARTNARLFLNVNGSATIDITFRIAAPQLEQGAFPTSYIPTTSAAVTRSADSAVVTPISSFYNASEGTLFAEVRESGSDLQYGAVSLDANTSDNRIDLRRNANSAAVSMIVTTAGAGQMLESPPLTAAAQTYKFIGAYKTDDVVACVNGGTIAFDTSVTLPTLTHLRIGGLAATSPATGNAFEVNGHIRRIAYYPKRLSNALLQSLTT